MRTEFKALFVTAAAASFCLLLGGCPGKLRDPDRFTDAGKGGGGGSSCPDVPTEILAMKCAGSSCHSGATPALGLDLVTEGVAARLVGKEAVECKGALADPAAPEDSILYQKIAGVTCGTRMPLGSPLADTEIACVKEWIAAQTPIPTTSTGTGAGGGGGATSSSSTGP